MTGKLDHEVIEKFKEFQNRTGKYEGLDIEKVELEKKKIEDVIQEFIKGSTPKYASGKTDTIVIKSGQARGNYNEFDFKKIAYLDLKKVKNPKYLRRGDILINTTGVGTAGRVTLFDLEGKYVSDSHITTLRYDLDRYHQFYLLYFFTNYGFKKLESLAEGTGGQVELSMSVVKNISIPIPKDLNNNFTSLKIQEAIVEFLEFWKNYTDSVRKNVDKKGAIYKAIRGLIVKNTFKYDKFLVEKFDEFVKAKNIDLRLTDIKFSKELFGNVFDYFGGSSDYKKSYYTKENNFGTYPLMTGSLEPVAYIKPIKVDHIQKVPSLSFNKDNDAGSKIFYHEQAYIIGGHHYGMKLKPSKEKEFELKYMYYMYDLLFSKVMFYQSKEPRANSSIIAKYDFDVPHSEKLTSIEIQTLLMNFWENLINKIDKQLDIYNQMTEVSDMIDKAFLYRTFSKIEWS